MRANHASDYLFQKFDQAFLGKNCEENGADENVINACKLGFWFTEEDKVIAEQTCQKYNYLVDIDMDGIDDPITVEWTDINENLTEEIMAVLDQHDVIMVRDEEFGCVSYLVRPWALDRVRILEVTEC